MARGRNVHRHAGCRVRNTSERDRLLPPSASSLLGAVALLAGVAAIAVVVQRATDEARLRCTSAPAPAGWNTAFAGSRGATGDAQRTTCGQVLAPESLGVTHPVLPCGAKVVLRYGDTQVLTEMIDNNLVEPGRQLEVTEALGDDRLGARRGHWPSVELARSRPAQRRDVVGCARSTLCVAPAQT